LRQTSEADWPDWLWARIEEVVPPGFEAPDVPPEDVPKLVAELSAGLALAMVPEGDTLECPGCGGAMFPVAVEHRKGLLGGLSRGVGVTVRAEGASGERKTLLEPVDDVDAWACSSCEGIFLRRRGA
jgi:hypothetical protein